METPSGSGQAPGAAISARLRSALTDAMRRRDKDAVSALRTVLGAIANAEAVSPPPAVAGAGGPHIAGAVAGVGAAEADRRVLTEADVRQVVQAEISEREAAASEYDRSGHSDRALRLRGEADVLRAAMAGPLPADR